MYNNNSFDRSNSDSSNSGSNSNYSGNSNFGNSSNNSQGSRGNSRGNRSNFGDFSNNYGEASRGNFQSNSGNSGNNSGYSRNTNYGDSGERNDRNHGGRDRNYGNRDNFGGNGGNFGNSNHHSSRRNFGRSSSHKPRFVKSADFHISKYIKKSKPVQAVADYVATHKFSDFPFCRALHDNITLKDYVHPTPIQDQSIPHLLENKDLIGIANTGSGKTAAFLLPIINKIYNNRGKSKALIIVPTRELATQIDNELRSFARGLGIFSVLAIGGTSVGRLINDLQRRHDLVIGTPGRIKDMTNRGVLNLKQFDTVVLDEVDRMLDMGFVNDIREVMATLPKPHQTLFFSATMDKDIQPLMYEFLVDPISVSVKTGETSDNIEQDVVKFSHTSEKMDLLEEILRRPEAKKVLIFGQTKYGVETLCQDIQARGFKAISIHGDKKQSQRNAAIRYFSEGQATIMVATDVAARGLDIDDITHVINYETPDNHETYTHRIGRTGRGNKNGIALTFYKV